jgi:hypothetical protein
MSAFEDLAGIPLFPALLRWLASSLLSFKMVAEAIDSVTGSFQLGLFQCQIRTIQAMRIPMVNLFLATYPTIGRFQLCVSRQPSDKIVRWNERLWVIFQHDRIHLRRCEYCRDRQNEHVDVSQLMVEGRIRHRPIVAPDCNSQSSCLPSLNCPIRRSRITSPFGRSTASWSK